MNRPCVSFCQAKFAAVCLCRESDLWSDHASMRSQRSCNQSGRGARIVIQGHVKLKNKETSKQGRQTCLFGSVNPCPCCLSNRQFRSFELGRGPWFWQRKLRRRRTAGEVGLLTICRVCLDTFVIYINKSKLFCPFPFSLVLKRAMASTPVAMASNLLVSDYIYIIYMHIYIYILLFHPLRMPRTADWHLVQAAGMSLCTPIV